MIDLNNATICTDEEIAEVMNFKPWSAEQYVDNAEMDEILQDKELVQNLKEGLKEVQNGAI